MAPAKCGPDIAGYRSDCAQGSQGDIPVIGPGETHVGNKAD
jgi:hypothetical protein